MTSYLQSIARILGLNEYRKARNLVLHPAIQIRLPLYIMLLSLAFLMLGIILGKVYFQQTYMSMLATSNTPDYLQQVVAHQAGEFMQLSVLLLLVYAALVTVVSAIFTHRLFGPVLPIKRHIRALQQGQYDQRVKLRAHDGMQDVAEELNRLADRLQHQQREP